MGRVKTTEDAVVLADEYVLAPKVACSDRFKPGTTTHTLSQCSHFTNKIPCGNSTLYTSGSKYPALEIEIQVGLASTREVRSHCS